MLMKAMKDREVVGILPDQVPSRGEGMWAPFFGRWAYTMTLPARLRASSMPSCCSFTASDCRTGVAIASTCDVSRSPDR